MFRVAPRLISRPTVRPTPLRSFAPVPRALSTAAPPTKNSRSWKSLAARIGIASALIHYYNTTDVFAEEPRQSLQVLPEADVQQDHLPTIESISEERRRRQAVQAQLDAQKRHQLESASTQDNAGSASSSDGSIEELEEEADQQGAFNPETGEINWDCPCLGGMAHGPCGDEFKAAFSCFVYSNEEPKGMDCIDKFKNMQNCFRQYPEVYGSELGAGADDDDDEDEMTPQVSSSIPAPDNSDIQSTTPPSQPASLDNTKTQGSQSSLQATSQPHSTEGLEENRRDLGLVPVNYKSDQRKSSK